MIQISANFKLALCLLNRSASNFSHFKNVKSSRSLMSIAKEVCYGGHGNPTSVTALKESSSKDLPVALDEVLVAMKAAPINPADINMIQGVYPIKPKLPAVGGNEGVGEVVAVGENVNSLKIGQTVIVTQSGIGTWRTHLTSHFRNFRAVSPDVPMLFAATLNVNICTAYRMLKDFVQLHTDDVVIQNGANSGVGRCVIQLCKAWNISSVCVVREREQLQQLVDELKSLGATHVITDKQLKSDEGRTLLKSLPTRPRLAMNCVSGKAAADLAQSLDAAGVLVTYGGMSKQPLMLPTAAFIFKDVSARGFWMTRWHQQHQGSALHDQMYEELFAMSRDFIIQPHTKWNLESFKDALTAAEQARTDLKQIFIMNEPQFQ